MSVKTKDRDPVRPTCSTFCKSSTTPLQTAESPRPKEWIQTCQTLKLQRGDGAETTSQVRLNTSPRPIFPSRTMAKRQCPIKSLGYPSRSWVAEGWGDTRLASFYNSNKASVPARRNRMFQQGSRYLLSRGSPTQ